MRGTHTAAFLMAAALLCDTAARATGEFRLKLDVDDKVVQVGSFNLRPMLRTEQRFRDQGLVLLKVFAGLRSNVLPWLTLQTYYAHKDKFYKDHEIWHMLVLDLIVHFKLGPLAIADRNGNELHTQPGFASYFYRYRNNLDVHFNPGLSWLRLWVADEIRIDADQARLNMNDAKAGIDLLAGKSLRFRLYYDLESTRRSKPDWHHTHVFQFMLILRLG